MYGAKTEASNSDNYTVPPTFRTMLRGALSKHFANARLTASAAKVYPPCQAERHDAKGNKKP